MANVQAHALALDLTVRHDPRHDRIVFTGTDEHGLALLNLYLSDEEADDLAEAIQDARQAREMALRERVQEVAR